MKKTTKTLQREVEVTKVDMLTGEVIESTIKHQISYTKTKEEFMIFYIQDTAYFRDLCSLEVQVLVELWKRAEFNTNNITIIKKTKDEIVATLGCTIGGLNNTIYKLAKKQIMFNDSRQSYILNPTYFFKGSEIERGKIIEITKQYVIVD